MNDSCTFFFFVPGREAAAGRGRSGGRRGAGLRVSKELVEQMVGAASGRARRTTAAPWREGRKTRVTSPPGGVTWAPGGCLLVGQCWWITAVINIS